MLHTAEHNINNYIYNNSNDNDDNKDNNNTNSNVDMGSASRHQVHAAQVSSLQLFLLRVLLRRS